MEKNMDISQFIDNVVAGNAAAAKENLNNILSARAFEAIDGQKKELAKSLFGGNSGESEVEVQNTEEVTDDEEAYAEEVEHDGEQLDEVSFKTATNAYKARRSKEQDYHPGGPTGPENVTKSGKYKSSQTAKRMVKKFGDRAVNRIDRLEKTYG